MVSNNGTLPRNRGPARDSAYLLSLFIAALIGLYLLITSTTTPVTFIWPYDFKRMLEFGLLFLLFLAPIFNRRIGNEFSRGLLSIPRWMKLSLLTVLALGCASAGVNAHSPLHLANSLSEVALLTALVLAVFVVAACRRIGGADFDRLAVGLLALVLLAVGLQELAGVAAAHAGGTVFNFRVSLLHFSFPRFFNQVQSWAVPVLIVLPVLFTRYRMASVLCAVILGLQWYIIMMTGARGTVVAVFIGIVIALAFLPVVRVQTIKWQFAGLLLGGLLYLGVMASFEAAITTHEADGNPASKAPQVVREVDLTRESKSLPGGESSFFRQGLGRSMFHTSGRYWMWKIALQDARAHPLLGIGPMNYACTRQTLFGHPHSFPVQLIAEWGMPAAFLTGLTVLVLLYQCVRLLRAGLPGGRQESIVAAALLTGAVAAAVHASLSGVLVMPVSQVTGLLLVGMLLGLLPVRGQQPARWAGWILLPALAACAGLLALGVHELRTLETRAAQLTPPQTLHPRIWQDSKTCSAYTVKAKVTN